MEENLKRFKGQYLKEERVKAGKKKKVIEGAVHHAGGPCCIGVGCRFVPIRKGSL